MADEEWGRHGAGLISRLHARLEQGVPGGDASMVEALLRARARRLAAPRQGDDVGAVALDILAARIGAERYAIKLDDLSEVMPLGEWAPVPGQPQYLLGVTNLRGEIRPVLDLHSLLGFDPPPAGARFWVAFLENDDGEVGLRVDGVERIIAIDPKGLTNPHEAANGLPQRFVAGIAPDALILLDTAQILALDVLRDPRGDLRRVT